MQSTTSRTANRGFASMDAHKQKEIARKGGRAAHQKGTAHEFTRDEARAAGRKGGERVSANREHMSRIGRIGGKSSAGRRQASRRPGDDAGHPGEFRSTAGEGNAPESFSAEPMAQHGGGFHGSNRASHEQHQQPEQQLDTDTAESREEEGAACPT